MFGTQIMNTPAPVLQGDFGLISALERVTWREELPRHLLGSMRHENGNAVSPWKLDEQVQPTIVTMHELFSRGVPVSVQALEEYFSPTLFAHRSDYAT